ncbi:MAG: hypothetical protein Q8J87_12375, partial [Sediminibacterium sp.]|nr:hypothetical protein [Sediminibacterium sp.]
HLLAKHEGWHTIDAVKSGNVFVCDAGLFTQPSASTLVDGIELLSSLFHPELFSVPANLRAYYEKNKSSILLERR